MNHQNNIQDELRSLNSELPVVNSPNPFSVPEGYFDGLAAQILAKVKEQGSSVSDELQELSPLLAGLSKKLPYTVPEGYFQQTTAMLPSFLKEEESPVLAAIGKELPYSVPEGYFDQVPQQIIANLTRPKAKVVPFFSRTWMRVAVAATIGSIIFFGGYRLLNERAETVSADTAQQPVDTSEKLVARNGSSMAQDIRNISPEDLEEFMNTVPLNMAKMKRAALDETKKNEVEEWLKDVSAKEMEAFLDGIPTADNNLLIID